jgi:hypothetical protein
VRWPIDTHDRRGDQPQHMLADAHDQLADEVAKRGAHTLTTEGA